MKFFLAVFFLLFIGILYCGLMATAIVWVGNNLSLIPGAILASFLFALAVALPIAVGVIFIGD